MRTPVILPEVGSAPIRVSLWFAEVGDLVFEGDRLVEVVTPGATFDVSAPATGRLAEHRVWPPDVVVPGQVLGLVETGPP
jgi:pyruvate/2-oxoglutarate dehydrogenase complex dihydrolipoamide acyltransferase (E2) component